MIALAQIDVPIGELKEFGQTSFNVEGVVVMTLFTFALTALVFALYKLRTGGKSKSGDTAVIETLADVIADKLKAVMEETKKEREDSKADRAVFMESFAVLSRGQSALTSTQKEIALLITGHSSKVDANQTAINQLSSDQQTANEQVANMNGDIIEIKLSVQSLLQTAQSLSQANNTMIQAIETISKNLLLILEKLEEETEAPTEVIEKPQAEIETDEAPVTVPKALHGVPVTPKPDGKQSKEASQ